MVNYWQFHDVPVIKPGHASLPRDPESSVCLYCVDSSAALPRHQTTEGRGPRVRSLKQPGERPLKAFKKNLTISCELMESVCYSRKITSSPSICVKWLPQEDVLGLMGDLGTWLLALSSAAWTPAPLSDPETPPPAQTLLFSSPSLTSDLDLSPPLFLSHRLSALSCLHSQSLLSVGPRSSVATVLTVTPPSLPTTPSWVNPTLQSRPPPS